MKKLIKQFVVTMQYKGRPQPPDTVVIEACSPTAAKLLAAHRYPDYTVLNAKFSRFREA